MAKIQLETQQAQASYGIGLQIGQQLQSSGLKDLDAQALAAGIHDVLAGNPPAVSLEVLHNALRKMHEEAEQQRQSQAQAAAQAGKDYLANNLTQDGVKSTESGLQYKIIKQGEGKLASASDRVRVHYTGRLIDGTVFDSSVERGQPAEFPVNGVIAGWIEALQLMPVGSKWELYIPQELAYGERGAGSSIPPYSALIFEVELLDIV
ncbi:FKBP-type peptidyl-prolyl cis-trans isomerase [Candidatus Schmidhempelia bombi]|uniref:Peptidyl-prolyl cis-trans isomerase n=1 Tax=Candidatus Schmidhempelia bombi str. Bimp TaxID=1387197 RepID=A0AB94IDV6_9GAMM|nr:FKBP-type peptidyl-prolyl cis-trans isomerase [Candidatus Schmidhempelia bombi]TEA27648.1 peptidylprolyl isomerase [Candidatus Schmidhempelia bombi str. Bimp]